MHCRWEATKRSLEVTPVSLPGVRCYEFIFGDDSMLKRAALVLILLFAFLGKIQAQDAVVTRNVYLRADPSTENDPITKLLPPASVHLIEAESRNGYYHVKTGTGIAGWVWGRNIQIQQGAPSSTIATSPTTANDTIADAV